jgi:hypothetical protein
MNIYFIINQITLTYKLSRIGNVIYLWDSIFVLDEFFLILCVKVLREWFCSYCFNFRLTGLRSCGHMEWLILFLMSCDEFKLLRCIMRHSQCFRLIHSSSYMGKHFLLSLQFLHLFFSEILLIVRASFER